MSAVTWSAPGSPGAVDSGPVVVGAYRDHATVTLDVTRTALARSGQGVLTLGRASAEALLDDLRSALEELDECHEHGPGLVHDGVVPCDVALAEANAEASTWSAA
jgi:hypothetical protein